MLRYFITTHEQTTLNVVAIFISRLCSLILKDIGQNLFSRNFTIFALW